MNHTKQVMNKSCEVNELYDDNMKKLYYFMLSVDVNLNTCFSLSQDMKQDDRMSFIDDREKEISNNESRGHWTTVHFINLTDKFKPI